MGNKSTAKKVKITKIDGSFIEVDAIAYENKVLEGEGEGMTTSDAQAHAEYYFIKLTGCLDSKVRHSKR